MKKISVLLAILVIFMMPTASAGLLKDVSDMRKELQDLSKEIKEMKDTMNSLDGTVTYLNETLAETIDRAIFILEDFQEVTESVEKMDDHITNIMGLVFLGLMVVSAILLVIAVAFILSIKRKQK